MRNSLSFLLIFSVVIFQNTIHGFILKPDQLLKKLGTDFFNPQYDSHNTQQQIIDTKSRSKREAYKFSAGIEYLLPEIQLEFSCTNREYGYYADVANNCQVFHVCLPPNMQWSFFCPNQTIFDQKLLICQDQYVATPCQEAEKFYIVNNNFGIIDNEKII